MQFMYIDFDQNLSFEYGNLDEIYTIWHFFLSFNSGSLLLEPSPKFERKRSSSKSRKKKKEKSKRKESNEDSDCEDNDALSAKLALRVQKFERSKK